MLHESLHLRKNIDGLCRLIEDVTGEWPSCEDGEMEIWFPEIWEKRPKKIKGVYDSWFPITKEGWQKRREILKKCIEETA